MTNRGYPKTLLCKGLREQGWIEHSRKLLRAHDLEGASECRTQDRHHTTV